MVLVCFIMLFLASQNLKSKIEMKKITLTFSVCAMLSLTVFGAGNGSRSTKQSSALQSKQTSTQLTGRALNAAHSNMRNGQQGGNNILANYLDDCDGANDTTSLQARGYKTYYRSSGAPGASPMWHQGDDVNYFVSYNGPDNGYIAADYTCVTGANDIDNWLVLPELNVTSTDVLSFYSQANPNSGFPDSIRVMYSAAGDSIPEATSWVELGRFKVNTAGVWQQNAFPATAASANGRFAIRYAVVDGGPSGNNSDFIGIDKIEVGTPSGAVDIGMANSFPYQYTMFPLSQTVGTTFNANVKNNTLVSGSTTLTVDVFLNDILNQVYTDQFGPFSVGPGATINVGTSIFTPADTGVYIVRYLTSTTGDSDPSNDTLFQFFVVDDSSYARDYAVVDGAIANSLGVQGSPVQLGQFYDAYIGGTVYSVSGFLVPSAPAAGTNINFSVLDVAAGVPNTVLGTTSDYTLNIADTGGVFVTLPFATAVPVTGGTQFFVSHNQVDTNFVGVAICNDIYTPATVLFNIAGAGWNDLSAAGFTGSFIVRPNMNPSFLGLNKIETTHFMAYPNPSTGMVKVKVVGGMRNADVKIIDLKGQTVLTGKMNEMEQSFDLTHLATGLYTVQLSNGSTIETMTINIARQ